MTNQQHRIIPPPELVQQWEADWHCSGNTNGNGFTYFVTTPPTEEVIRLDKEGFHYRGQFIADAGEAHRLMVEFLRQSTKPKSQGPTNEDLLETAAQAVGYEHVPTDETCLALARAVLARWGCQ